MKKVYRHIIVGTLALFALIPAMSLNAKAEAVAKYNEVEYGTFEEAFTAASSSEAAVTIEILGAATIENKAHVLSQQLTLTGSGTLSVEDKVDTADVEALFSGARVDINGPTVDGQQFTGFFSKNELWLWNCTVKNLKGGLAVGGAKITDKTSPTIVDCSTNEECLLSQNNPRWGTEWGNDTGLIQRCSAKKAIIFAQKGAGSGDHR